MMVRSLAMALLVMCCVTAASARRERQLANAQLLNTTYKVIIRTRDQRINAAGKQITFGTLMDVKGNACLDNKGAPVVADSPDFTSYFVANKQLYSIVQLESTPSTSYLLNLEQDVNGDLRAVGIEAVDSSAYEGSIRPCAGQVSPWGTHLGAEESYPNVRTIETSLKAGSIPSDARQMMAYYGIYYANATDGGVSFNATTNATQVLNKTDFIAASLKVFKPYMYGHPVEISVNKTGKPVYRKWFAFGRASWEQAYVMPDMKTWYLSDDAGNSGSWYKWIADKPMNWTAGTLYAVKVNQTNAPGSANGTFDLTWVSLGHLDGAVLEAAARKPLTEFAFSHIFLTETPNADRSCPSPDFRMVSWDSAPSECLKLNTTTPNVEMLAAGLESRRYVTYVGATSQFSKSEGQAYAPEYNKMYIAISFQQNAMLDNSSADSGSKNEIKLAENQCGCVYAATLDANYNAFKMEAEVCGKATTYNGSFSCSTSTISNPDNLSYMEGYDWLLINEDASYREETGQDLVWMHNVRTKEDILVGGSEAGAEATGGNVHTNLYNGFSYITQNYQGTSGRGAPVGYFGAWKLSATNKNVTFERTTLKGRNYYNPYSPFQFY